MRANRNPRSGVKRWSMVILVALLVGPTWALGEGKAMKVGNAGFEAGRDQAADAWSWWSRTQVGSASWAADDRHGGARSVCIRHDGPRDWAFSSETRFPAKPGQTFRVSAWVKVASGEAVVAVVARGKGKVISWDIGSARCGVSTVWRRIVAPVEVPDGCDSISVRFVGDGKTVAWVDDVAIEEWKWQAERQSKPKVSGYAKRRVVERLGRGLVGGHVGNGKVYLSWRLLAGDPAGIAFNVYRQTGAARAVRLNAAPIRKTTDFVDATPPKGKASEYAVRSIVDGKEGESCAKVSATPGDKATPYVSFKLRGDYTFQKAGIADLDGDGRYDMVIKQPHDNIDPYVKYWKKSPETYKLEAYRHDGTPLWRYDMGWAIERGIWYSPYVVYDLDGDGKAEVVCKSGQGDPRDAEGKVREGAEYVSILDGMTGKLRTQVAWPSRKLFGSGERAYNYSARNQLGVAYLDGKTPCLIVVRGTYNVIVVVAYEFHGGKLRELWRWNNEDKSRKYWGQGAHWMHAADVDGDGRDEVVIGSMVLDDNGTALWTTGLGHPDHCYVGDLDPTRKGLEIYYGMESRQSTRNGMCMVDAATGKILWGYEGSTRHVHSRGLCSDIDPRHVGAECYSADTDEQKKLDWALLHNSNGEVIRRDKAPGASWGFGPLVAYWDADPQRELVPGSRIVKADGTELGDRIEGRLVAVADILGDWREELIVSVEGELRIHATNIPAGDRRVCLMQDPLYRMDVVVGAMGYYQSPMLSYDMATRARGK